MSSLVFLAAVLSCEVTRQLVAAGYGLGYDSEIAAATNNGAGRFTNAIRPAPVSAPFAPLAITACTGAGVPVVLTTQYPHGFGALQPNGSYAMRGIGGATVVVSGVLGNTAANNISTDPRDRTVGLPQGTLAVPLTSTTLALYGQDQDPASDTVGQLIPLIGDGTYTSGGTITPAFTDGAILIGRENVRENSAPPRIVLVPRGVTWGPRSNAIPNANRTAELRRERKQRSTRTERHTLDVHCWGQRQPPDPAYDFDVTNAMAQTVVDAAYLLFGVKEDPGPGVWDDQKETALQFIKAGHLLTFSLSIDVPVLDNALPFVPLGSSFGVTVQTTTPEVGARFPIAIN